MAEGELAPAIKRECEVRIWAPTRRLKELLGTGWPIGTTAREWVIIHLLWPVLCSYSVSYLKPDLELSKDKVTSLFKGSHTRTTHVAAPTTGAMTRFMMKTNICLACKTPLTKEYQHKAVCRHCEDRLPEIYVRNMDTMRKLEMRFSRLWTECQRCQESVSNEVVCTNSDCPIFYMCKKAQKDAGEQAKVMDRFDYSW
ncbi:DNA-directed DNA polymerase delta [Coemansia sp. RSA 1972]|nr:DNA-directed DNA polymerase delta [Coemansia sp. RSA 1972]